MPSYQVFADKGMLSETQKEKTAQAITEALTALTGAPKWYVQVIFQEIDAGSRYICGKQSRGILWIRGDVRIRTPEQNAALMHELARRVGGACGIPKENVWIDLCGIEPENIMKFDTVFPAAGREDEWYQHLPQETKDRILELQK